MPQVYRTFYAFSPRRTTSSSPVTNTAVSTCTSWMAAIQPLPLVIYVSSIYFLAIAPIKSSRSSKPSPSTPRSSSFRRVGIDCVDTLSTFLLDLDLSDQTDTSSVYFFDHRGTQQADTCLQNFPVRQLSADTGFKCLWGVDRHQHSGKIERMEKSTLIVN